MMDNPYSLSKSLQDHFSLPPRLGSVYLHISGCEACSLSKGLLKVKVKRESVPKKMGVMSACKSKLMIDAIWALVNGHQAERDCYTYMVCLVRRELNKQRR